MNKQPTTPPVPGQPEEIPVRPPVNSIVNPEGVVLEPISEVVKKEKEEEPPVLGAPPPTQSKQPPAAPEPQQDSKPKKQQKQTDELLNKRIHPEMEGEKEETLVGGDRQMQSDLRYTSVMRKDKDLKKNEAEEKVDDIAGRADNLLMKLKTVFPYDFFPSTVTIDSNKVTVIDKTFFASETVTSILLEEITDVVVSSNFFLAQMTITYSHHPLQPLKYKVSNLRKKEALRATEIIQGLLVLRISEGIDLSKLKPDEILTELSKIGKHHENLPAL